MTAAAILPSSNNHERKNSGTSGAGFLDGIQLPNTDPLSGLMMGMNGPSMNTLKKSQSSIESKHPCVYQYGSCSFGDECKFAEIDGKVCAKFLKGGCSWGNNCCWKHTTNQKIPKGNKDGNSSHNKNSDSDTPRQQSPQQPQQRRYSDETGILQDDLYNGLDMQGLSLNRDMQQQNILQQFQLPQSQINIPPNLLGNDLSLAGIQNFPMEDNRFNSFDQMFPNDEMNDLHSKQALNQSTAAHCLSTIVNSLKEFDDRQHERVVSLQIAIDKAERERNEECDKNRRCISALMSSVDHLVNKLRDLGIPLSGNGGGAFANVSNIIMDMSESQTMQNMAPQPEPQKQKVCQHCGKSGRLMLCGRCKVATFCNQVCQREAWSQHSQHCHPPRQADS